MLKHAHGPSRLRRFAWPVPSIRQHAVWLFTVLALVIRAAPTAAQPVDWRLEFDLDQAAYDAQLEGHTAEGLHPVSISVRADGAEARYDTVWAGDPPTEWRHAADLTRAQAVAWITEQAAEGYRPRIVSARYTAGDRYVIVATHSPEESVIVRWGLNAAQLSSEVNVQLALGRRGIWVTSWLVGGVRQFTIVFSSSPSAGWWITWNQSTASLQSVNAARHNEGGRIISVASDGSPTAATFTGIWAWNSQPEGGWREFFGQTNAEFEATVAAMTAGGFRPTLLTSYTIPSGLRVHSAWVSQPIPHVWHVRGRVVASLAVIDDAIRDYMEMRRVSAAQVAVTHEGRLVFNRAYTLAVEGFPVTTLGNRFRIASVTKPTVAVAIMQQVEKRRLSLDDRMVQYIGGVWSDARVQNITIRDLLRHSGGWNRNISGDPVFQDQTIAAALGVPLPITQDYIIQYMRTRPLNHAPGTGFYYSNFGYLLLGKILEVVAREDAQDYLRQHIWTPLDAVDHPRLTSVLTPQPNEPPFVDLTYSMQPSAYRAGDLVPMCYGAWNMENCEALGGWAVSARDLARFTMAIRDPSFGGITTLKSVDDMLERPTYVPAGADYYYGLGWEIWPGVGMRAGHSGDLPGSHAEIVVRFDQTTFAMVTNVNSYYTPDLPGAGIVDWLNPLIDTITSWPVGDLACRADFTLDANVNSQDFFDFITAFFAVATAADFNDDGSVNSQDFFDFLAAFFEGCP